MKPNQIIIEVAGGVVQEVYCSDQGAHVTLVDWDSEGAGAGDPSVVEISVDGNRMQYAFVAVLSPRPLSDLAQTDTQVALRAARVKFPT